MGRRRMPVTKEPAGIVSRGRHVHQPIHQSRHFVRGPVPTFGSKDFAPKVRNGFLRPLSHLIPFKRF
jgi:hypothetical protein